MNESPKCCTLFLLKPIFVLERHWYWTLVWHGCRGLHQLTIYISVLRAEHGCDGFPSHTDVVEINEWTSIELIECEGHRVRALSTSPLSWPCLQAGPHDIFTMQHSWCTVGAHQDMKYRLWNRSWWLTLMFGSVSWQLTSYETADVTENRVTAQIASYKGKAIDVSILYQRGKLVKIDAFI